MSLNPVQQFIKWERETPDQIFFRQPIDGKWVTYSFRQSGEEIRRVATALTAMGLPPRSNIAILSKNCAHWIMTDLAIWMSGHVSVPLYPTLTSKTIQIILEHSEAKVIFVGKLDQYDTQREGIPSGVRKISFPLYGPKDGYRWEDLISQHEPLAEEIARDGNDLATIMYTSGTTGLPKGVMATYNNLGYVIENALKYFGLKPSAEHFFSYLPLSHIAERALVEMGGLYTGSVISFSESLEKFPANLMDSQPTVFLAVPRIWSKFQEKIVQKIPQSRLNILLRIPFLGNFLRKALRKKLGLAKAQWIFTGAAPISRDLLDWYQRLGITIHEVYGMTENLAYSHINLHELKFGTVGKAWPGIDVKITEEGEILTRHKGVMMGYYKEPSLTAEVMTDDHYFKTGDKGLMDAEGFLTITGRFKDLFKTDKGKYVAPGPIELKIADDPDVEQVCVVGMGIPQPIALIILSAAGKSKPAKEVEEQIEVLIQAINEQLEHYEKLETAVILKNDWTIENGLITPTMKVKRNEVEKIFLPRYQQWFNEKATVVWES